ncbi:uncharacterized protein ELE39_002448 [Cryptosporidium sp. chipmunk genotype I]|uniref:uncharacterized protein n=1 Tax=Cryptosporidium sp. chipmunk genotype I TaxID=1280935 RepID=UPI00351A0A4B|nr:hypothetical protein ELE39_002448 [Cryptosporidium sp. chipmunk genotype I]
MRPLETVTERSSEAVENSSKAMEVNLEETSESIIPNYVVFLRELFVGMIGVHAVYIFVNFIFRNYPGSLLSLLLTISAIYTHFDRRVATYSLNTGVELLLGITIGFSVYSPVQGFEKYFNDPNLKRITLPQLVYCALFAFISVILARFERKFCQNKIMNSKRT